MPENPRLDILIYAHDGRGLGHVSRSVGVGMGLRRLFPSLKVLFVSGCRSTAELIGEEPLDWLKLPAYETRVVAGKSKGIIGKSMYSDAELGVLRAKELAQLVALYKPRLVLVDHTPQGKHKELVPALSATNKNDTKWILGVRGVVGSVIQARASLAADLFKKYYYALLWYGDNSVLGTSHCRQLQEQYDMVPLECGYVVRLAELCSLGKKLPGPCEKLAGTLSIPWLGEKSMVFLANLATALKAIPSSFGHWHLFIDTGGSSEARNATRNLFESMENCYIEPPGIRYVSSLLCSKTALIYGGYNSLMDIVYCRVPALVILREMEDKEQQIHLEQLLRVTGNSLITLRESMASAEDLRRLLVINLQKKKSRAPDIQVDGAAVAARYLHEFLHAEP